ncbi:hypothetical protein C8046_10660 [Serinibacter arcticus]|uniref:NB-ARC domain-containing protein n=1 Tax=Serinibacter arcticus TaxID=1655435 RepID=A0A2U1ZVS2_9MICO|nr:NB-ARC domain-containing protein [Serinibacter arcticus]PWD51040.1 hypothetical protein C8046_10660 [Serinibacter arcticus]
MDAPTAPPGLDAIAERLRDLRVQAGQPSFTEIAREVGRLRDARGVSPWAARPGRVTVYDVFRDGRKRVDIDLVLDVLTALGFADERVPVRQLYREIVSTRASSTARPRVETLAVPADVDLLGRELELEHLLTALTTAALASSDKTFAVVTGLAGVGKTALARAVTHRLVATVPGAFAVEASVRTASGDSEATSVGPDHIVSAVDAMLQRRRQSDDDVAPRCVVLLDDVVSSENLEAVVAGLPSGSLVVATCRRDLVVTGTAAHVRLGPLDTTTTAALLRAALPTDRVVSDADSEALHRLAELCGGLPLAVSILQGQIAARPGWPLSDVEMWLARAEQEHVGFLDSVHDGLDPGVARALRLCALHPARLSPAEIAALTGTDDTEAERAIAVLVREHLLVRDPGGRLDLHDLVRGHAQRRATEVEPYSQVKLAVERLGGLLLHSPDPGTDWLEEHVEVVVTTAQLAADHELPAVVTGLADLAHVHLRRTLRDGDSLLLLGAARRHGLPEERAEADRRYIQTLLYAKDATGALAIGEPLLALTSDPRYHHSLALVAEAYRFSARYDDAIRTALSARDGAIAAEDLFVITIASSTLVYSHLEKLEATRAREACEVGLAALADAEAPHERLSLLHSLGRTLVLDAEWDRARQAYEECRVLAAGADRQDMLAFCALQLEVIDLLSGDVMTAVTRLTATVESALRIGDAYVAFEGMLWLGLAHLRAGDPDAAAPWLDQAREAADIDDTGRVEAHLAELALGRRDADAAERHLRAATTLGRGGRTVELLVAQGLGDVAALRGDLDDARQHWGDALALDPPALYAVPLRERVEGGERR